jgi:hypothetical protein
MYIAKCVYEFKGKNTLYYTVSKQGICYSDVDGVLQNKTPSLFQVLTRMLGAPHNLQMSRSWSISKEGYEILRGMKNGEDISQNFQVYGWRDVRSKDKKVTDPDFSIFRSKRKETVGAQEEEYRLAWSNELGLCKMRCVSKEGVK